MLSLKSVAVSDKDVFSDLQFSYCGLSFCDFAEFGWIKEGFSGSLEGTALWPGLGFPEMLGFGQNLQITIAELGQNLQKSWALVNISKLQFPRWAEIEIYKFWIQREGERRKTLAETLGFGQNLQITISEKRTFAGCKKCLWWSPGNKAVTPRATAPKAESVTKNPVQPSKRCHY